MEDFNHDAFQSVEETPSGISEQSEQVSVSSDVNKSDHLKETRDQEAISESGIGIPNENVDIERQDIVDSSIKETSVESALEQMHDGVDGGVNCVSDSVCDDIVSKMDWAESVTEPRTQTDVSEGSSENIGVISDTVESSVDCVESSSNPVTSPLDQMHSTESNLNLVTDDNTGSAVASTTNIEPVDSSSECTETIDKTVSASDEVNANATEGNMSEKCLQDNDKDNNDTVEPDTSVNITAEDTESSNMMDYSSESATRTHVSEVSIDESVTEIPVDKSGEDPFKSTVQSSEEVTSEVSYEDLNTEATEHSKESDRIQKDKEYLDSAAISSTTEQSETEKLVETEEQTSSSTTEPKSSQEEIVGDPNSSHMNVSLNIENRSNNKEPVDTETCEAVNNEEGADEEMCIIPDTEREISQVSYF